MRRMSLQPSQLTVERTRNPKVSRVSFPQTPHSKLIKCRLVRRLQTKLSKKDLIFGKIYSDHMLEVDWDVNVSPNWRDILKEGVGED